MKNARARGSRTGFYAALALIVVAAAGAIWWASQRSRAASVMTLNPNAPATQAAGYTRGSASAPVEIIEFADFECPGCGQFATVTEPDVRKNLIDAGLARIRFFDFPLEMHRNSVPASMAAACAADQNKFWEMHDVIFQGQNDWNTLATDNPRSVFRGYAQRLGLDVGAWEQCYDSAKHRDRISANQAEGTRQQVRATPTFIIGDKVLQGVQAYDVIKALVDSARLKKGPTVTTGAGATATATPTTAPASKP